MTQTKQQCSTPDQLLTFLRGQLSAREEADLQHHLDDCVACRERLESTAADASVWNEAREFFASGALHGSSKDSSEEHEEAGQGAQRIRQVLDSLGPTDDLESLGRIGGYEVTGVVGAGGMGVVLKAHDRTLDRIVAVKVMSPHLASSGSARKRFAREAKAAAAVLHPNVIAIHSVASEDANPYLVMPFVRGTSLQKRIDSQGPLPLKDTLRIGAQIAAGLAAAHEQGLVHRDIKPANILLEEGVERVTITDFGLARAVDDASMTCSGVIAGTPQYMSPEQARGEPIDARSDLFSLGGVLYAMCTGRSPFRAETTYGVLHRIANDKPTSVCEVNTDVPVWLGHLIERLMAKRPEDRFESAAQVAELLEGCLAHVQQPVAIPLPDAVAALAPKKTRRPPIGKFIAAAAFAFALVFAGVAVVLELNKGTLTVKSDVEDIRVRITRGDELISELTVTKTGQSVRVAAGQYNVEVIGETDDLTVENGKVTLHRAGVEIVRIVHNANNGAATRTAAKNLSADQWLDKLQGTWRVVQHDTLPNNTKHSIPRRRLYSASVRGNRMEIVREQDQPPLKFDLVIGEVGPPQQIDLVFAMSDRERQTMLEDWGDEDEPLPVPILKGIIEADGDLITICSPNAADSQRPIEFLSGEEQLMWNFTRPGAGSLANVSPSKSSPELPPVKIVVHDEEGKPLEGVKVSLFQLAKDQGGQVLEINETSNASGLAVNRNLPYGHYELSATTPDGWYLTGYRSRLNVEFEKGVDVILVAPTPGKTSKLVISSDIMTSPEKISGLRFGGLTEDRWTQHAPEPEGSDSFKEKEFSSFPTITNGIEYVGAEIGLQVTRNISQPAPSMQQMNTSWKWSRPPNSKVSFRYLIANEQARSFDEGNTPQNESLKRLPVEGSEFFKLPSPNYRVGAELLKLREPTPLPLELDIPAGDVRVKIGRFVGKPSAAVMAALNWQPQEQQPELWLQAYLAPDSVWVERLINIDWINSPFRSGGSVGFTALWRDQALQPGERLEIPLGMKHDQKTSLKTKASGEKAKPNVAQPALLPTDQVIDALVTFEFNGISGNATLNTFGIGWVVDQRGHILVPSEMAPRSEDYSIEVRFADGSRTSAKRVFTFGHLALLKPDKAPAIAPIKLNSKQAVQDGDQVLAILNGTDVQKGTVTSARKTIVSLDSWPILYSPRLRFPNAIETDFKSDPATLFGAPLLTPSGEVVGMLLNYKPPMFAVPLSEIQIAYREFEASHTQSAVNSAEATVAAEEASAEHSEIVPETIDSERATNAVKCVMQYLMAVKEQDSETINSVAKGLAKNANREKEIAKLVTGGDIPKHYKTWFVNHSAVVALGPLSTSDKQMNGRFLLFKLSLVDERWSIVDIDLEVEEKLLERFRVFPGTAIAPANSDVTSVNSAATADQAATADEAYQAMEKLLANRKMDWTSTERCIETAATRMTSNIEFAKHVLDRFRIACEGGESNYQARRHLLAVLTKAFHAWGQNRWSTDPASIEQHAKPSKTWPQEIRDFELSALESVVSYGHKATRSDIVDFVRAARALHHPDAKPFLQAVLLNPQSLNSSPFATPAQAATPPNQSTWSDNVGGSWPDARFVAAVGLAELGDPSAIDWLLAKAQPNDSGLDESIYQERHERDRSDSLRESSRCALIDLFGHPKDLTVTQLSDWWKMNRAVVTRRMVRLKSDFATKIETLQERILANARIVVEAYVASAISGNVAQASDLAKNSPADPKRIQELPEFLNVQRLKIETVYINDPAKPTQALATSVAVKLDEKHKNPDGQRDGFMVFTLELTDERWFVIDIDFETESGAEKELKKFLEANPNSIGIPPQS
jgi:uncharacterized protein (TIGR03067 family)